MTDATNTYRLPDEARLEMEVVLGESEQSTLAVGTCLAEIVQQAEAFIAHIKSKFDGLDDNSDESAAATLDDQYRAVSEFLSDLRSGIDNQNTVADHVIESSQLVSRAARAIEDVATESKALCINTMIEAARLGDQGRQFTVIAGRMHDLSKNIQDSNQRITELTQRLAPLLEDVKKNIATMNERTDEFATGFADQRERIGRVTAKMRDTASSTLAASDERLAEILALTNKSLESLQTNDMTAQRLRRILTLLSEPMSADNPMMQSATGAFNAPSQTEGGLQSGDIELF